MIRLPVTSLAYALRTGALLLAGVFAGRSLAGGALGRVDAQARPAVQDMLYHTLRQYGRGDFFLAHLLDRPVNSPEVRALLLLALERLETHPNTAHTIVDQAVTASGLLAGGRFRGLVNAVLRHFLRRREALLADADADDEARWRHPAWWLARLREHHPDTWENIAAAGNRPPPMALRVNARRSTRAACLARLEAAGIAARAWEENDVGILLERPRPVETLPGFAEGLVSVQDPGAQWAAKYLDPPPGSRVLDACAAPGGKAAHLLECGDPDLWALDLDAARCKRIEATLARLGLAATVRTADAARPESWWDGQAFDAILADVPCSASGVTRRHPDTKWLRRPEDTARFASRQADLLNALWRILKPGGTLLYATCSVFPEENGLLVARFLASHPRTRRVFEQQYLPTDHHDGFYYCRLEKLA